jgi:hypothetical protein
VCGAEGRDVVEDGMYVRAMGVSLGEGVEERGETGHASWPAGGG